MKSERDKPVIVGLDLIRFAAAALVMCFHLCAASWGDKGGVTARIVEGRAAFPELLSTTWFGWLGVEIFFIVSGLVIVYSADGVTAPAFLRSRILRLYPAAWVCATLSAVPVFVLGLETHRHLVREWLDSVVLYPFVDWDWVDPVYWTLGIEMAFYALIFVLLAWGRFHYLERTALALGSLSSAYWLLGTVLWPGFLQEHLWNRTLELSLVPYGCFFATGALAYVISRDGLSYLRFFAMGLFVVAGLIEIGYKAAYNNVLLSSDQAVWVPNVIFLSVLGLIFVSMRFPMSGSSRIVRLVRLLGLATYPLYLFHQIIGAAIMRIVLEYGGSRYPALSCAMLSCLAGSLVIANVVEPPIRAHLRRALLRIGGFPVWTSMSLRAVRLRALVTGRS